MLKEIFESNSIKQPTAVCLGCFDGLHRGHIQLIKACMTEKNNRLAPAVLTFDQNPQICICGNSNDFNIQKYATIMSKSIKLNILEEIGVKYLYSPNFSNLRNMQAEEFVSLVLKNFMKAEEVFCGADFRFAKDAKADVKLLKALGEKYNIKVFEIDTLKQNGEKISSSKIRQLLTLGEIDQANGLLGRPFCYDFVVEHGKKLGRKLGTPTINQRFPDYFIVPKHGVYASFVHLAGEQYYSVTNVAEVSRDNETDSSISETWIPDYRGEDLYGKNISVFLIKYIRDEIQFKDLNLLKHRILNDAMLSKKIYTSNEFK